MKKLAVLSIFMFMLIMVLVPAQSKASNYPVKSTVIPASTVLPAKSAESAKADALLLRLEEIKAMDKSTLTPAEKRKLRKETRSIKSQLKAISGGVYLSSGAIILILLLIILL